MTVAALPLLCTPINIIYIATLFLYKVEYIPYKIIQYTLQYIYSTLMVI